MTWRQQLGRWVMLILLTIVAIEGTAWVAYWLLNGERYAYATVQEAQAALVETRKLRVAKSVPVERKVEHAFSSEALKLHPFLGFVVDHSRTSKRRIESNELGFLGPSLLEPRQPDELRLAIFGGSVAFGLWASASDTLVADLAQREGCRDRPIRVFSAALGGYKQPQQLQALSYVQALGAKLDGVINIDGFNDVVLAPRAAESDSYLYPRNWGGYANRSLAPNKMNQIGRAMYFRETRKRWAENVSTSIFRRSVLVNLIWHRYDRLWHAKDLEAQADLLEVFDRGRPDAVLGPIKSFATPDDLYATLVRLWTNASIAMDRLVSGSGGHYVHFLQPNQYVAGSKPLTRREKRVAYDANHQYRRHVIGGYPHLQAAAPAFTEAGVSFRDLTPLFAESDEEIYMDSCCHFTGRGYEVIAQAVAASLGPLLCGAPSNSAESAV